MGQLVHSDVHINVGEYYFGSGNVRVRTLLGTCIAITLWHPVRRIGGMCHFLLPTRNNRRATGLPQSGLYADDALELFADSLEEAGTPAHEYSVKVAGGGNMFPGQMTAAECRAGICVEERRRLCTSIGCVNIRSARKLLEAHGFKPPTEHVGGPGSRTVILDLSSGHVWIKRGAAMQLQ
jgi:chemotaxis protein CheD